MMARLRIGITGGAGFVGGHLTRQFRDRGHEVTVFTRRAGVNLASADLSGVDLSSLDALIHAAWDFTITDDSNVTASLRLFESAKRAGIGRVVFISSLSAFEGAKSRYGATKLAVEKHASALGACSVRLGFVSDDSQRGMSGSLKRLAALPVIPLPDDGRQPLYTIRAEDLGAVFLRVIEDNPREPVSAAHPEPVNLKRLIECFARQQGKRPVFLPVPWRALWLPIRMAETAGIPLKFRSDSLVSLMNQDPNPDFGWLKKQRLGLTMLSEA